MKYTYTENTPATHLHPREGPLDRGPPGLARHSPNQVPKLLWPTPSENTKQ